MSRSAVALAELEASLRAAWRWDDLAVWADALQDAGDPRGERVAIDLAPGRGEAWRGRRRAILGAWLGSDRAADCAPFVQHGFVHEARYGAYPVGMLASPLGAVTRSFSVTGGFARVSAALGELAAAPRPWLSRLAIAYTGDTLLGDALADQLIAATPALVEITLIGRAAFARLPHPALRVMRFEPRAEISVPAAVAGGNVARATPDDVALLLELVDAMPDVNQLCAAYADLFREPLVGLLAWLDAMGLVALDGPLVRLATADRAPARGSSWPPLPALRWEPILVAFADHATVAVLGEHAEHVSLVRAARDSFPLTGVAQRALDRYADVADAAFASRYWERGDVTDIAGLRRALNALVELHAWWPQVAASAPGWDGIEQLATAFAGLRPHVQMQLGRRMRED